MKFPIGLRITGKVNNVTELGVFVDLPHHHHGLIHHKDFGDKWASQRKKISQGDEIRVVIFNNYRGKIALSLARVNDPDLIDPTNSYNNKADFSKSLTELLNDSRREIKTLKENID
ncbi:S1 RNA-binding domain-containing protein [Lactobacillus hominis]|uniref:RNA-binding protein n=1 Tax=Lactobacillus hominis DSM 23910 = CRBIP 24.179 TaxID=1423758 RepID=I7IVD7_9LACO|nr:S1 RNA-binding domain-containing protein [Lactobacillus hominis]KRM85321.1 RNA-binding protein [Lactobacillus hominis DSM 23910 = CRBIP 24.179]MCT3347603.1 S1 RNA-binding domain-containing protein [Lactobacillus hominis]CCI81263.1 RNA-binding protein [Lactobacillus hominis DSM 23910 = CRBIP 24.179]